VLDGKQIVSRPDHTGAVAEHLYDAGSTYDHWRAVVVADNSGALMDVAGSLAARDRKISGENVGSGGRDERCAQTGKHERLQGFPHGLPRMLRISW
jgi:hypothetical protein